MKRNFEWVFDDKGIKRLRKLSKNESLKSIIKKMLDKAEIAGSSVAKLIDNKFQLYELKSKSPSIRIYFQFDKPANKLNFLDVEIKKSKNKQQKTISSLKKRIKNQDFFLFFLHFQKCSCEILKAFYTV